MEWPLVRLDSLYNIARGGSPRPIKDFITEDPDGINWVKIGDATASNKYIYETKQKIKPEGIQRSRLVNKGDFILSNSMSFGRPYIMATSGCIHDGWLVLSAKDDQIDQDFLYHMLGSPFVFNQFDSLAAGSTVRNLNKDLVSGVKIPLLPISEQKRIVALLDTVFADLEQTRVKTEQNLKNARELFDSYLQQVFSQKGEGWEEHKLSDLCVLISGQHIDAKNYNTDNIGIGYLTGPSDFGSLNPIVTKWTEHPKRTSIAGDILITVKGSGVGKVNIMSSPELAISRQLMAVRATSAEGGLLYWFLSMQFDYFQSLANGAAIPGISRHNVLDLELSIPKLSEQPSLLEKIIAFNSQTVRLENVYVEKIKAIDELKKSILQKAFSGELNKEVK
jgi:type I restriction enzyme S subunit